MSTNNGDLQPPHPPRETPNSSESCSDASQGNINFAQGDGTAPMVNISVNATTHIRGNSTIYACHPPNPTQITTDIYRVLLNGGPDGQGYRLDGRYPRFNVSVDTGFTVEGNGNRVDPNALAFLAARRAAALAANQRSSSMPNPSLNGTQSAPAAAEEPQPQQSTGSEDPSRPRDRRSRSPENDTSRPHRDREPRE